MAREDQVTECYESASNLGRFTHHDPEFLPALSAGYVSKELEAEARNTL